MRNVVLVSHEQLKRVLTRFERDFRLGLAGTEMQMIEVIWNRLVEGWQLGIDQQMMMARILPIRAGGRNSHVAQTERELEFRRNRRSVLEIDEIDLGARTCPRRTSGPLTLCQSITPGQAADEQQCCEKFRALA